MIALRVAPTLLAKLRKMAKKRGVPYQTLMHEILERAAKRWD
jgi:predicted DNA binding CopG/RHH family protein